MEPLKTDAELIDLSHSRKELLQIPRPDSGSKLHAENGAGIPLFWCEIIYRLSVNRREIKGAKYEYKPFKVPLLHLRISTNYNLPDWTFISSEWTAASGLFPAT